MQGMAGAPTCCWNEHPISVTAPLHPSHVAAKKPLPATGRAGGLWDHAGAPALMEPLLVVGTA